MRKQKIRTLCLIGITCCFTSCNNEMEEVKSTNLPMDLTAQVAQVKSRATSDNSWIGDGTELISVSDGNKVVEYKIISVTGAMEPTDDNNLLYWASAVESQPVEAWYPATALNTWMVQKNQSAEGFQASDLLYSSVDVALQGNKTLLFKHQTAKVMVYLQGNGTNETELEEAVITIENAVLTGKMEAGKLVAVQEAAQSIIPQVITHKDYVVASQLLMIPQLIKDVPFIRITTKAGKIYEYIPKDEDAKLEGTCENKYYITVGKPGISVIVEKSASQWGSEDDETVETTPLS